MHLTAANWWSSLKWNSIDAPLNWTVQSVISLAIAWLDAFSLHCEIKDEELPYFAFFAIFFFFDIERQTKQSRAIFFSPSFAVDDCKLYYTFDQLTRPTQRNENLNNQNVSFCVFFAGTIAHTRCRCKRSLWRGGIAGHPTTACAVLEWRRHRQHRKRRTPARYARSTCAISKEHRRTHGTYVAPVPPKRRFAFIRQIVRKLK